MATELRLHRAECRRSYAKHKARIAVERKANRDLDPTIHRARNRSSYATQMAVPGARAAHAARGARYRLSHPDRIRSYKQRHYHKAMRQDMSFVVLKRMRSRVTAALKRATKGQLGRTADLLGCSPQHFKWYLERLFLPGMSWANRHLWHIDHRRPLASFDLADFEDQRSAFHFSNCQPLWAVDNLRKGATV